MKIGHEYQIVEIDKETIPNYSFKVIISGKSGVGKTSIIRYEMDKVFSHNLNSPTIFDHFFKNYKIDDKIIRLQIWDTGGEDTYEIVLRNLYKLALCILVVFSLDDESSFLYLSKIIKNINELNEIEEPLIILVGNKSDNISERKIEKEDIEKFCDDYNVENYFEVSAKSGDNINDMFKSVVTQLYVNYIVPNYSDNHTNLANNTNKKVLSNNNGGFDNDKCNICSCLIY